MVLTFARLKLALLRNGFRANRRQRIGAILSLLVAIPMAAFGFVVLAAIRGRPSAAFGRTVAVFVAVFAGSLLIPLLAFGLDETLDPSRLAPFPLARRDLMAGLLTASLLGVAPLALTLALTGTLVGLPVSVAAYPVVIAALVIEVLMCLTGGRALTTLLARALRSRKGRDASSAALALVAVFTGIGLQVLIRLLPKLTDARVLAFARVVRFLPPALAARAAVDASAGHWMVATIELAGAAATVVVLAAFWANALDRVLTTPETAGRSSRGHSDLVPSALAWMRDGVRKAETARLLRYTWRDPRQRVALLSTVIMVAAAAIAGALLTPFSRPDLVLGAALPAYLMSMNQLNLFGYDGGAFATLVTAEPDWRQVLIARNVVTMLLALPVVTATAVALSVVTGGWGYIPIALMGAFTLVAIGGGVGDVISVRAPLAFPESTNPWASSMGAGCVTAMIAMLGFAVVSLLDVPVAALIAGLRHVPVGLAMVSLGGLGYGWLIWRAGVARGADALRWRLPETLDAVSPKRA